MPGTPGSRDMTIELGLDFPSTFIVDGRMSEFLMNLGGVGAVGILNGVIGS